MTQNDLQVKKNRAVLVGLWAHRLSVEENATEETMEELADLRRTVDKAIKDLHFVMAGGDPCKVCAKVCMMGEGNCQPVWTGEKTED